MFYYMTCILITNLSLMHIINERACRDIKTEKAHEQDWDGTLN